MATGATVAAVSVDSVQTSEDLRKGLSLPFPLLCDTERRVIARWGLLNARVRGGIAIPAVFVIERNRSIRFAATDDTMRRVSADQIVSFLQRPSSTEVVHRKLHVPLLSHWRRAIRNILGR